MSSPIENRDLIISNGVCNCKVTNEWDPSYTESQVLLFKRNTNKKHTCEFKLLLTFGDSKNYHCCFCNMRLFVNMKTGEHRLQQIYKPTKKQTKINLRRL